MAIVGEALRAILIARVRNDELHFQVRAQAFFHLAAYAGAGEFSPLTDLELGELTGALKAIAPRSTADVEGRPVLPTD